MRETPRKEMIALAARASDDEFAAAVKDAMEGEFVSARSLKAGLESAGFTVEEKKLKVLTQVNVHGESGVIASGTSGDATDALLQAALGYLRELPASEGQPALNR